MEVAAELEQSLLHSHRGEVRKKILGGNSGDMTGGGVAASRLLTPSGRGTWGGGDEF
jgi:hypothetical protein